MWRSCGAATWLAWCWRSAAGEGVLPAPREGRAKLPLCGVDTGLEAEERVLRLLASSSTVTVARWRSIMAPSTRHTGSGILHGLRVEGQGQYAVSEGAAKLLLAGPLS